MQADRHRHGEVEPGVMPGDVAIGVDPAEILDQDRGPRRRRSPVGLPAVPRCRTRARASPARRAPTPGRRPERQRPRRPAATAEPDEAQTSTIGEQQPGVDLGQQGQRPDGPRRRPSRSDGRGDSRARRPASRASVQNRLRKVSRAAEVGVGEDPGHRQQRPARREPGGAAPAPGRSAATSADQDRERQRRGEPAREDVEPGRVGPSPAGSRTARPASRRSPAASGPAAGARRCRGRPARPRRGRRTASPALRRVAT